MGKSLFSKMLVAVAVITFITVLAVVAAIQFSPVAFGIELIVGALVVFALLVLAFFWRHISRPLHAVFKEMKALLAGKHYRRVITQRVDEIGILAHFFNEVTKNFEKIAGNVAEGERMSSELALASKIQSRVLPKEMPPTPGLVMYAKTRPAVEVGGDSFDIIPYGDNTFIYVGDVTGHGTPSALVMMMVNTLVDIFSEMYQSAYDILVSINRFLKPRIESTMFMTMAMLRWNDTEKKLYLTGAGHEHVIIFHRGEHRCEVRKTGGIALGMLADNSKIIKEEPLPVQPNDLVILYTDGLVEAKNTNGEMFGIKGVQAVVEQFGPTATPEQLFTQISQAFAAFVEDQTQEDDITLVIAQIQ